MSVLSPRMSPAITLHSMCQPGRPMPHGLDHVGCLDQSGLGLGLGSGLGLGLGCHLARLRLLPESKVGLAPLLAVVRGEASLAFRQQ